MLKDHKTVIENDPAVLHTLVQAFQNQQHTVDDNMTNQKTADER